MSRTVTAVATAFIVLLLGLAPRNSGAEVLRVPADYGTIQTAFDAVSDEDTVLVSLGTYAEELLAPLRRFWLIGDVETDTGNFERPTIDPSTLDSAQFRRCMTIPDGCELTIERMAFVNRAPMYPREDPGRRGGILVLSQLTQTLRYCSFDSVHGAFGNENFTDYPQHFVIEDCRFRNGTRIQVRTGYMGTVEIMRSSFHARHFWSNIVASGGNSRVELCTFEGDSVAGAVMLLGENVSIRHCEFGPIDSLANPAIRISGSTQAIVENNVLHDLVTNSQIGVLYVEGTEPVILRHNVLMNNGIWLQNSATHLNFWENGSQSYIGALVDSNLFQFNDQGQHSAAKAVVLWARVHMTGNRFIALRPYSAPCIDDWSGLTDNRLRYNQFVAEDYAIASGIQPMDAIWNYWGHSTGPYNELNNPDGQGARVGNSVLFDPWSPDTNFLMVPDLLPPLPERFFLEFYPNPFNSSIRIVVAGVTGRDFEITLHNLLGQVVDVIHRGPLTRGQLSYQAPPQLGSGVYFLRASDHIGIQSRKIILMK